MARKAQPKPRRGRTYLKQWREFRQKTQEQAAPLLGIDQSTLSRLERGISPYDQDFLEKAAFVYMCEPQDLIMRNPKDQDAVWSITDNLKKATPSDRVRAAAVIDALLKKSG